MISVKLSLEGASSKINDLYDDAMRTLQNGYSDEEVKTFTPKQVAVDQYLSTDPKSVNNLSSRNLTMMQNITGSTDPAVIAAKLDNIANAAEVFNNYLGLIENARDAHLAQLSLTQDNSPVIVSLKTIYSQLGS